MTANPLNPAQSGVAGERVRLGAVLDGIGAGVLVEDEQRRIAYVNQEFCQIFAIPAAPESLSGFDCVAAVEAAKGLLVDPDGFVTRVDEILTLREIVRDEPLAFADGRYFERDFVPLEIDGVGVGNLWVYWDVTQRVREEQGALRHDRAATAVLAVITDAEVPLAERQQRLLAAGCELLGLEVGVITRHVDGESELLAVRDPDGRIETGTRMPLSQVFGASDDLAIEPVIVLRADSPQAARLPILQRFGFEACVDVPIVADGVRTGTLVFAGSTPRSAPFPEREISLTRLMALWIGTDRSRRAAIRDLAGARDAALEAGRLKSEFLATMSHELRTPMNGVIGAADLLRDTALDDAQAELVRLVHQSSHALLSIVDDVLDTAKVEAGRLDLVDEPFELREVVESAAQVPAPQARARGLTLTTAVDPVIPAVLIGDPGRLRQILVNVIGNAVKFTDHGEVVVEATLLERDGDTAALEIAVTDTGIGIPEAARDRLFEPFVQADAGPARRHGGTGLGLVISERLATLMGGGIELESVEGEGTTVRIQVRLLTAASQPPIARPLAGRRILLHAPTARAQHALARTLEALGAEVRTDASGDDASALGADAAVLAAEPGGSATAGLPTVVLGPVDDGLLLPVRAERLALAVLEALGETVPQDRPRASTEPLRPGSAARVLIVEDNEVNRTLLERQLERLDVAADVAVDGHEAIAAAARQHYAVILMDLRMPGLDGLAVARAIRAAEQGVRVPIVAVTANATAGDRDDALAAGMDDHLPKPVTLASLREVLARWLPATAGDERSDAGIHAALDRLADELGGAEQVRRLAGIWKDELPKRLAEIASGAQAPDAQALSRAAHTLRGASSIFGAERVGELCHAIEVAASAGPASSGLRLDEALLADLVTACDAARIVIDAWVEETSAP
ncbi:unannotated protein [freshwater metagenome]|uniref:histidine kinase n=1 Tax=freshwater metagenome TaxID=449393 RepID=A0A6J7HMS7_9ZZZZ